MPLISTKQAIKKIADEAGGEVCDRLSQYYQQEHEALLERLLTRAREAFPDQFDNADGVDWQRVLSEFLPENR